MAPGGATARVEPRDRQAEPPEPPRPAGASAGPAPRTPPAGRRCRRERLLTAWQRAPPNTFSPPLASWKTFCPLKPFAKRKIKTRRTEKTSHQLSLSSPRRGLILVAPFQPQLCELQQSNDSVSSTKLSLVLEEEKSPCPASISFIFPPRLCIPFTALRPRPKPTPRLTGSHPSAAPGRDVPRPRCPGLPPGLRAPSRPQTPWCRSDRFPVKRGPSRALRPSPRGEGERRLVSPASLCFLTSSDLCSTEKDSEGDEHGYSRVPGPPSPFPLCGPSLHLHAGHPEV